MHKRRTGHMLAVWLVAALTWAGWAVAGETIEFRRGDTVEQVDLSAVAELSGTVQYQGPVMSEDEENWKGANTYSGASLRAVVESVGGLADGETLGVVAVDGWYKILPRAVVYGETAAGVPILAAQEDGDEAWEDAPTLIFLPDDERFSNEDMLSAFGPTLSHYFGETPSTTGMRVRNVAYLVVDYDGTPILPAELMSQPEGQGRAEGGVLTVVKGAEETMYALDDLVELETLTAPGTFTNSASVDYTATYTGVPLMTLLGNVPEDATVRVTASDGYSMNYAVEMLADVSAGTWVLAYKEDGSWMPEDPGPLRIVQIGPENPHFTSSLSAKMVERIELLGTYEPYSLLVSGAVERRFTREELEAGVGCPCHTATVTSTSKGEASTYTGLPLWRLVGYVDDEIYPAADLGIHYNDEDFNDALAATAYDITLTASDGYAQTVPSDLIARDDRFIVAFKKDGVFLDPESDGYLRFVYDDSVELPADMRLRSVKFLTEIDVEL